MDMQIRSGMLSLPVTHCELVHLADCSQKQREKQACSEEVPSTKSPSPSLTLTVTEIYKHTINTFSIKAKPSTY